jgi:trigger factor
MASQVETLSPVLVEIKVEVPWTQVSEDLESAYRLAQRKAHIRGFRPGKVPREVVKSVLGKKIRAEVVSELVRKGLGEAVEEHKLEPVAYAGDAEAPEIADGKPLAFSAKLEVRPTIESVDTGSLEVERTELKVDDSAVQAEIERMREQTAELVAVDPPRPAQAGDTVTFDLEILVEGTARPELGGQDRRVELGGGKLLAEMEAGLTGAKIGDKKDIALKFPDDYGYEELRSKDATFRVEIKGLQTKLLPDVDDDLAKDLSYESLDAMKKAVRERLEKVASDRADALMREALVEALIDKNPVPVPPSLTEQETRSMLEQYLRFQYMMGQGVDFNEQMHAEFRTRAERKVRAGLLFGAIAKAENIRVEEADIERQLLSLAEQSGKHIAKVRAEHQGEQRRNLELQLLEKKLLEYLKSRATIRAGEPKGPEAASEATPSDEATEKAPKAKAKKAKK